MSFTSNQPKNISVIICHGDLNAHTMIRLKHTLSRLIGQKRRRIVLDLAKAKHVDFSGLCILIERLQKVRSLRGDIRVINIQPEVSKAFESVGVHKMIESFESKHEAIRSFQVVA
ncbi:MAG: hypothetical protein COV74_08860 [Candidatus Omnitrophica bacterium CG11_big_fil_rev_8_21_14_0_20_45_26]|uniref:Anti-sigma factor antagonist n=1 Tax=Candidatus Abzuiibacterium crystallinum TaxID=1974748 RepID=A0A2H0LLW7_9BACT|nr:MAG: hypothetical protein COV74_08860 [Candidatus Omnitrophica bacterium CG11_big_fil_rev_8_21_14_0_20_45_26]PIW64426.1 MAG: hypothetical protein COW12_06205 [Candidatus Omnitrophica bacterium CG12_big_fil_rev_8_21_14_0_65_45_16]